MFNIKKLLAALTLHGRGRKERQDSSHPNTRLVDQFLLSNWTGKAPAMRVIVESGAGASVTDPRKFARECSNPSELDLLARSKSLGVLLAVVMNPHTSFSTLMWIESNPVGGADDIESSFSEVVTHRARLRLMESPRHMSELLGMPDDVATVESLLCDHPSQIRSMLGWRNPEPLDLDVIELLTARPDVHLGVRMVGFRDARR